MRNAYNVLAGKTEGKKPLRNSVKIYLMCESVEWIHLAQDKVQWLTLLHMAMSHPVPLNAENFVTS
jgi:hypothetical protein